MVKNASCVERVQDLLKNYELSAEELAYIRAVCELSLPPGAIANRIFFLRSWRRIRFAIEKGLEGKLTSEELDWLYEIFEKNPSLGPDKLIREIFAARAEANKPKDDRKSEPG